MGAGSVAGAGVATPLAAQSPHSNCPLINFAFPARISGIGMLDPHFEQTFTSAMIRLLVVT